MIRKNLNELSGYVEEQDLDLLITPADDPSGAGTPAISATVLATIEAGTQVSSAMGDACPTTACTKSC